MHGRISVRYGAAAVLIALSSFASGDLRLLDAVKRRDHKALTSLVRQVDVNAAQPDGATALAWAVHLDDREAAELLLAAGAKVNTVDEYGETPLTLACSTGNAALVEKLLKAGADANAARWNGETALMIAASSGSAVAVKLLVAHGANVNWAEPQKDQTALMWAAAEGHSDVVEELIKLGADVKASSKTGFTPLVFAAMKDDARSVKALLAAGADPNYALPSGTKALVVAASYRSAKAAGALVDGGADPNVADRDGTTPLHTAAQTGELELVTKLLAKGADPNARTIKLTGAAGGGPFRRAIGELTPLHVAAKANELQIMRALVAAGADPSLKAQANTTLLMSAAGSGHLEPVKYAYELAPEIDAVNEYGSTVMHAAVTGTLGVSTQSKICEVISFLAEKGAKLDERDRTGRTPIAIADILPIDNAVELLTRLIVKSGATPKAASRR
jgi:ankyrin repeat protein